MENLRKIQDIKKVFLAELSAYLEPIGYKYVKTKEMFVAADDLYKYKFYIYLHKRTHGAAIETKGYISLSELDKKFKDNPIPELDRGFCGGIAKFICEKYFQQKYWNEYSTILFFSDREGELKKILNQWEYDFKHYYMPFFQECKDPKKINEIVNDNISKVTFISNYRVKVMYSLDVAKMAGMNNEELLNLAVDYENYIKKNFDDGDLLLNAFSNYKHKFFSCME
jgi:hypothetical protein